MRTKTPGPLQPSISRSLTERVAWISGAASGIGEATARLFASEGAQVAVVDRNGPRTSAVAEKIAQSGGTAVGLVTDVADEKSVRTSIEQTVERFGRLDILVNNAGMVDVKLLHEYSVEDWDQVMNVNVRSMFLAFKHALPHLRRAQQSWVVNVGSISSFVGQARTPVYTTCKHAVMGLTRSIALDYAAIGLRCNCICPGITDTPMLREHLNTTPDPQATLAARLRRVPLGVAMTPRDVARSILFLSCDDSAGITGTSLLIDGGYLAAAEWDTKPEG